MTTLQISTSSDEILPKFRNNGSRAISSQRLFLSTLIGFIIGSCLGYFLVLIANANNSYDFYLPLQSYYKPIVNKSDESIFDVQYQFLNLTEHKHHGENTTIADKLYNDVKVLCWILTMPDNHKIKAQYVKKTWGQRCNKLLFFSSQDDEELNAIGFNVSEGRKYLWDKTRLAFTYVYEHYIDDYDWFMKADDDTYVIMENLRFMLSPHNTENPIYFGSKFQLPSAVYMSGGAGYVLSRESVRRLVKIAFKNPQICRVDASVEDLEIGVCLTAVGVVAGDTRDDEGKSRFHPLGLDNQLEPDNIDEGFWLWNYSYYKFGSGIDYVSDKAVSFHYLTSTEMFICEYFLYHVKAYGIWSIPEDLPQVKLTFDEEMEIINKAENDRNLNFDD